MVFSSKINKNNELTLLEISTRLPGASNILRNYGINMTLLSLFIHFLFFCFSFGYFGLIEFFIKIIKKKFFLFLCLMSLLIISIIVIKEKTPDKNKILNKITKKK